MLAGQRTSVVVVCTRNRPAELESVLRSLLLQAAAADVWVVDGSDDTTVGAQQVERAQQIATAGRVIEHVATSPGLARQRNVALDRLKSDPYALVHFVDDDTVLPAMYVEEMERTFAQRPEVAGVGGVVVNQERQRHTQAKRVFLLHSRTPGRVLVSGRNVIGHYPEGPWPRDVEWLPGCCMSYRVACLGDLRFDDRLRGYSWGEDFDFSYRLSRRFPLTISRGAECRHDESPANRLSAQQVALVRTVLLHAWVREHRHLGLRLSAYWWSLVGEVSLRALDAVVSRDAVAARTALGIAHGAWHVMRHGSSRSFTG